MTLTNGSNQRMLSSYAKLIPILQSEETETDLSTIMSSSLFDESRHELDSLVDSYHRILQSTLDVYAPEKPVR